MSEKELQEFIAQNRQRHKMLDEESGLEAIKKLSETAEKLDVLWAVAGGFAMYLYNSPRFTKDVDIIANKRLPLESHGQLVQGGEHYEIEIEKRKVPVDWIVRNDSARKYYEAALAEAFDFKGISIIIPEWLVIMKYIAGRFKDQEDSIFLLRQNKLVDRKKIKEKIIKIAGHEAWALVKVGLFRWFDIADGKIADGDENESRREI
ncbi:MAG: hypothetical protein M3T96_05750 [Acidobacteriota bacterium]|nr:hypothetical protein [Acidobacteriota bacterium]